MAVAVLCKKTDPKSSDKGLGTSTIRVWQGFAMARTCKLAYHE